MFGEAKWKKGQNRREFEKEQKWHKDASLKTSIM